MKNLFSAFAALFILSLCSVDVCARELIGISPEDNSSIEKFSIGDRIKFTTSFDDECGCFKVTLIDLYREEHDMDNYIVYSGSTAEKDEENQWVFEFFDEVKLMKDHRYKLYLEGHSTSNDKSPVVATVYATYTGAVDAFVYSDAEIVGFTPDEGAAYTDIQNNYFFITYSKDVEIDTNKSVAIGSDGKEMKFEYCGLPYFEERGKTVWQLNIPKEILSNATGKIKLRIYANDLDGLTVKGNAGIDENSYQEITYDCFIGYPAVDVYPAAGNVNKLAFLNFSCTDGISIKNPDAVITLYNSDNSELLFGFAANELVTLPEDNNVLNINLPQPILTEGDYILEIPEGVFSLGTTAVENKAYEIKYSIVDRMQQYGVEITPADNSVVNKLSRFVITLKKWDAAIPYYNNSQKITLTDENGSVVAEGRGSIEQDRVLMNQCVITLDKEIETSGTYRLNIPYRAFIVDHTGNYYSEEMYFDYIVEEGNDAALNTTIKTTVMDDGSLDKINVCFNEYSFVDVINKTAIVTINDINNNIIATGSLVPGVQYTMIDIKVNDKLFEEGSYYAHIPANSLKLGSKVYQKELVLAFDFNRTSGIDTIFKDRENVKVYSLSGILIGEGKVSDVLKGQKGVYIVNGKKVVKH